MDILAPEDRTIVLVTISRHCGDDVISRIKSALPDSDIIDLSQLYVDRDAGATTPGPMATPSPLTDRQREILDYLLRGLSNKEIGRSLHLSEGTVKNYLSEMFRLLSVSNRTQAARYDAETA